MPRLTDKNPACIIAWQDGHRIEAWDSGIFIFAADYTDRADLIRVIVDHAFVNQRRGPEINEQAHRVTSRFEVVDQLGLMNIEML